MCSRLPHDMTLCDVLCEQVQEVGRLELAHNACVDALRRLLSKRLELVQLMFGADMLKADWEQAPASTCTRHLHVHRMCAACAPPMSMCTARAPHAHCLHTACVLHAHCTRTARALQEVSHLTDARLSLLVERREMVGALDGQPTRASFYKRHPDERGR